MLLVEKQNGRQNILERLSPLENYPAFNLPPDFFVDQFYIGVDGGFLSKEINFAGNHILVLNSFIPGNFDLFALFYHISPGVGVTFNTGNMVIDPKVIPILPTMSYDVQYNKLYRTQTTFNIIIVNDTWSFTENPRLSTPILVLLSRDIRPVGSEVFKENRFKYALGSSIPTTSGEAQLTCLHGFNDQVQVGIMITDAENPLTIEIYQTDTKNNSFLDAVIVPADYPFHEVVSLSERISARTLVKVNGGGIGETSSMEIDFLLSQR